MKQGHSFGCQCGAHAESSSVPICCPASWRGYRKGNSHTLAAHRIAWEFFWKRCGAVCIRESDLLISEMQWPQVLPDEEHRSKIWQLIDASREHSQASTAVKLLAGHLLNMVTRMCLLVKLRLPGSFRNTHFFGWAQPGGIALPATGTICQHAGGAGAARRVLSSFDWSLKQFRSR